MAEEQQVELDLDGAEETVIDTEAEDTPQDPEPAPSVEVSSDSEQDEFQKAESNTQKRIDRLTKKMREAQRRERTTHAHTRLLVPPVPPVRKAHHPSSESRRKRRLGPHEQGP